MGIIRNKLISLDSTKYYHCISRCVRRAFLCGLDSEKNKDYNYRKSIIREHLILLSNIYAIEICAYSIMCNHIHLVLHVNVDKALSLTDEEIIKRWSVLYPSYGSKIQMLKFDCKDRSIIDKEIQRCRQNLYSISSFMKCFNQKLSVIFNKEDNCKGRFWEGRFKSVAILDQANLIDVMAYVDLNPIRAKMVSSPEEHDFSSVSERFKKAKMELNKLIGTSKNKELMLTEETINCLPQLGYLMPFNVKYCNSISVNLSDYFRKISIDGKMANTDYRSANSYASAMIKKLITS